MFKPISETNIAKAPNSQCLEDDYKSFWDQQNASFHGKHIAVRFRQGFFCKKSCVRIWQLRVDEELMMFDIDVCTFQGSVARSYPVPETNIFALAKKRPKPNRKVIFQPSRF